MTARQNILAAVVGVSLCLVLAGCGSNWQNYQEQYVRAGCFNEQTAPDWVKGRMPAGQGEIYFVGRGIGYNIFDEREAYDQAVNHVLQQLGKQVSTRVSACVADVDNVVGLRFYPGTAKYAVDPKVRQLITNQAKLRTDAVAGDLVPRDCYFEQWYLQEEPEKVICNAHRRMKRYKCWVLMSINQAKFDALVQETRDLHRIETVYPHSAAMVTSTH